jgi:hypothetical protein
LRRPRQSGRWLQTQTDPALPFTSSIGASQAGQIGGVSFTLLMNFGPHSETASKSSSDFSRVTVSKASRARALMRVIPFALAKLRASHEKPQQAM